MSKKNKARKEARKAVERFTDNENHAHWDSPEWVVSVDGEEYVVRLQDFPIDLSEYLSKGWQPPKWVRHALAIPFLSKLTEWDIDQRNEFAENLNEAMGVSGNYALNGEARWNTTGFLDAAVEFVKKARA